jgi:YHS domain-containing protein
VNYLYGTKLVRFCCKNCLAKFERDPSKYASLVP